MDKKQVQTDNIRLDIFLSQNLEYSRNQLENLIKKGFVSVNNKQILKSGYKLKINDIVSYEIQEAQENTKEKISINDISLDIEVIYEDDDILVINKPSNLTVHDAPSVNEPTLVDWLKSKNYSLSTISGDLRHGIVHRLDKGTSGVMVIAKNNNAHIHLSNQLQDKSMGRYYLAMIDLPLKENIIIEQPIARNPKDRLKMAIVENGRYAKSAFYKIENSTNNKYELICAKLFTGRTHQIRVHLNYLNRHILGDVLYGFKGNLDIFSRVCLHAYILYLYHPVTNKHMSFMAKVPSDMQTLMDTYFSTKDIYDKISKDNIIGYFDFDNKRLFSTR
ncbi:RluA family pseudouridine synthase [Arcobacter sp. FWKO B]|uniref:RluA family pseudouridine synthase n=1 Tax=Arcobacter sp. FWKO B TaxID=2593672 RepID=UPI0018A452FC|nr:RluA family pseudouridine synthase [Arcobacter sp. FWKO B]QOG11172.1 RluA family pseudouridine synthase [Arcobacter sp. FWKO B]